MHSQPLPLAPAGLHIFYLCSLEKKWLVAVFLLAVMECHSLPWYIHLVTNLPLISGGAACPTAPIVRVLGKSLAHPAHGFGLPRNRSLWLPRAGEMSATSHLPQPML